VRTLKKLEKKVLEKISLHNKKMPKKNTSNGNNNNNTNRDMPKTPKTPGYANDNERKKGILVR
jgi:hypothetical protein